MKTKSSTKSIVITALFIALSFVGSNIKIFGTIAFDSLPGFTAVLLLGSGYGAVIGCLGHLLTALTSGFPFTIHMHLIIAASMAITMLGFGYTYKALKNKVSIKANLIITGIVGVILNAPVSLAFSIGAMALITGKEAALGLLALLPVLVFAAIVNIIISVNLFRPLEKVLEKLL